MADTYFRLMLCAAVIALAGCSGSTIRWQDTSGRGRGQDLARPDLERCKQKLGYPGAGATAPETLSCMNEHGWKRR